MIPVTDQELNTEQWRTTTDAEIALCDWHTDMQEAAADAMLEQSARNLGLMVLCMTGGIEYERRLDTLEYSDDIEDRIFWAGGSW